MKRRIPINIVKPIIEKLENTGKFEEAYLGIYGYDKEVIPYLNSNLKYPNYPSCVTDSSSQE